LALGRALRATLRAAFLALSPGLAFLRALAFGFALRFGLAFGFALRFGLALALALGFGFAMRRAAAGRAGGLAAGGAAGAGAGDANPTAPFTPRVTSSIVPFPGTSISRFRAR
jgi:uncharacterized membrane protein